MVMVVLCVVKSYLVLGEPLCVGEERCIDDDLVCELCDGLVYDIRIQWCRNW